MICRSVTAAFAAVSAFFIPATALLDGHQISAAVELGYLLRSLERFCLIRRQVSMPTFTFEARSCLVLVSGCQLRTRRIGSLVELSS